MGAWRAAALAAEFGFSVVGSMVGGIVVGRLIDQRLGSAPAFFLLGLLGGLIFSIYLIYLIYRVQVSDPKARPRQAATARGAAAREDDTQTSD